MRRLTVDSGILRRRAASEKLLASTTFANITRELRSVIAFPPWKTPSFYIDARRTRGLPVEWLTDPAGTGEYSESRSRGLEVSAGSWVGQTVMPRKRTLRLQWVASSQFWKSDFRLRRLMR